VKDLQNFMDDISPGMNDISHSKVKYMHLIETDTGHTDISIFYP
jgi:hypothetical protein